MQRGGQGWLGLERLRAPWACEEDSVKARSLVRSMGAQGRDAGA